MIDRRAIFFIGSAVVSALLLYPTPPELRWVGQVMVLAFVVLALASWADHWSRSRGRSRSRRRS